MNYADIVSTGAFVIAAASLGWQFFTWNRNRKKEDTPLLKVYIHCQHSIGNNGKPQKDYTFNIENVGNIGVTILEVKISDIDIRSFEDGIPLYSPQNIVGSSLQPCNIVSSSWIYLLNMDQRLLPGAPVKITCKTDTGATVSKIYTLSEANS